MKKGYKIDGSPLRDTIYVSPESQKEKKGRREQKGYLNNDWEVPKHGERFGHPSTWDYSFNPKQSFPTYIKIKLSKQQEKFPSYKETPISYHTF